VRGLWSFIPRKEYKFIHSADDYFENVEYRVSTWKNPSKVCSRVGSNDNENINEEVGRVYV